MNLTSLAYDNGIIKLSNGQNLVSFYGIIIVCGAILALFLSNYRAHKDGYDWNFFGTVFIVAFPCGILGARVWYMIATFNEANGLRHSAGFIDGFLKFWDFRSGGLAIQGGAIGGILAGVLYVIFRRKGTPVLKATDYAVPTILVAQAIGRWGNFFNQEVFGHAVTREAWSFLPGFILNNMTNGTSSMIGSNYIVPTVDGYSSMVAPLFLIEGVINLLFFFVIGHALPAFLGKHYKDGDSTFSYFIAYGFVRVALEPLRNATFIMGVGSGSTDVTKTHYQSYMMAIAFIVIGVVLILANHVLRMLSDKGIIRLKKFLPQPTYSTMSMSKKNKKEELEDVNDLASLDFSDSKKENDDGKQQ